jgi:hypothetical protein
MKISLLFGKKKSISAYFYTKLFLVIALLPSQFCFGQDYVYIDTSDFCIGTITRYYEHIPPMHYMKTSDRSGKFLFRWQYTPQSYLSFPFSGYNVKDFTISGDTLFVCGEDPSGVGFYAWVDMNVSSSLWQFNIYNLFSANAYVTDVRRIRVFYLNNRPNILLIGNYVDQSINTPAVVHIKNDSDCWVAYRKGEHFDDIAVLDNYVVTVARKGYDNPENSPHFMRVLHKNNFSLSDNLFWNSYSWGQLSAKDRILLQNVMNDKLVSVYHVDSALYINTYSVNTNGILQCHRYHSMPTAVIDPIRDVTYNVFDTTLMVIHSTDSIGIASRFRYTSVDSLSWIWSRFPDMQNYCTGCETLLLATSQLYANTYMVSGISQNKMVVWKTANECVRPKTNVLYNKITNIHPILDRNIIIERFPLSSTQQNSERMITPFVPVCERGKFETSKNSSEK